MTASRLQRWGIQLSSYQFDIKYRTIGRHQNADTLSHFPMATVDQEPRTLFDRETEHIHNIQMKKMPVTVDKVAVAIKNDVVLVRVIEFTCSA